MSEINETESRVTEAPESGSEKHKNSRSGELWKFGVFAAIMLGAVLVVALLRPVIFSRIVPAVLGEGLPATPAGGEHDVFLPMNQSGAEEAATPETIEGNSEATAVPQAAEEEGEMEAEPTAGATAVPPQTHTVQPGETLTAIAKEYGVTVQALIDANQIATPNRITAGTELIIPDSSVESTE